MGCIALGYQAPGTSSQFREADNWELQSRSAFRHGPKVPSVWVKTLFTFVIVYTKGSDDSWTVVTSGKSKTFWKQLLLGSCFFDHPNATAQTLTRVDQSTAALKQGMCRGQFQWNFGGRAGSGHLVVKLLPTAPCADAPDQRAEGPPWYTELPHYTLD